MFSDGNLGNLFNETLHQEDIGPQPSSSDVYLVTDGFNIGHLSNVPTLKRQPEVQPQPGAFETLTDEITLLDHLPQEHEGIFKKKIF